MRGYRTDFAVGDSGLGAFRAGGRPCFALEGRQPQYALPGQACSPGQSAPALGPALAQVAGSEKAHARRARRPPSGHRADRGSRFCVDRVEQRRREGVEAAASAPARAVGARRRSS